MKVRIPDAMTRFQCNQQGCCCKGWSIWWDADDALELVGRFATEEQREIMSGAQLRMTPDGILDKVELRRMEPDDACQFLVRDGRCVIHAKAGPAALPHLCRVFPSFAFDIEGRREMHYDAVCPEVLNQIDESDGPFEIKDVEVAPGSELDGRAQRPLNHPEARISGRRIDIAFIDEMQRVAITALNNAGSTPLTELARISIGIARLVDGSATELVLPEAIEVDAWQTFVDSCVEAHHPEMLSRWFESYKRFIFDVDLDGVDFDGLQQHMAFDPAWRETLDPDDPALAPLLRRYLAHRFFSAFDRAPNDGSTVFTYGSLAHSLGTGLRYAVGISRWLERPVDRLLLKVALGASEYLYRTLRIPSESMPWFGLDPVA